MVSNSTRREIGQNLKTGTRIEVKAKGIEYPVTIYEALGIGKPHKLYLPEEREILIRSRTRIPFKYEIVEANHLGGEIYKGEVIKLSQKGAEVTLEKAVPVFGNLKMRLMNGDGHELPGTLYGKVLRTEESGAVTIRFTSVSPELETLLRPSPPNG